MRILLATIAATSLMTLFSYYISKKYRELYKEPVLIKKILVRLHLQLPERSQYVLGWIIHYFIGLAFILVYDIVWEHTYLDPTWFCGILFGIASGLAGIGGWMIIFSLPERTPLIDFRGYYIQLFFAHIVFALTAVAVYKLWEI